MPQENIQENVGTVGSLAAGAKPAGEGDKTGENKSEEESKAAAGEETKDNKDLEAAERIARLAGEDRRVRQESLRAKTATREAESIKKAISDWKSGKAGSAAAAFKALGLDQTAFDVLVADLAGKSKEDDDPAKKALSEVELLREEIKKRDEELAKSQQESQKRAIVADISSTIKTSAEKYPFISEAGDAVALEVFELADQEVRNRQAAGDNITPAEAKKIIEAAAEVVEEQYQKLYERLANAKKPKTGGEVKLAGGSINNKQAEVLGTGGERRKTRQELDAEAILALQNMRAGEKT